MWIDLLLQPSILGSELLQLDDAAPDVRRRFRSTITIP